MNDEPRHFGIDWRGHPVAHSGVLGLMAGGLVNMGAVALDYTRPADTWWVIGTAVLAGLLIGLGRLRAGASKRG